MSHNSTRSSHRLRIAGVCAAAALLLAGGGYALTGAAFTDQQSISGNTVGTASLKIGAPVTTPVKAQNLLPGGSATTPDVLTFTNGGTVPFTYEVTLANVTAGTGASSNLLKWIPVTISDGTTKETGTLAAPPTLKSKSAFGTSATGAISVTVGLDANADNSAQNNTAGFDLVVTASQVPTS